MAAEFSSCPICRATTASEWIEERQVFLVDCEMCSTFTITMQCQQAFEDAWKAADLEVLPYLEQLSRYLRFASDDADREVTEAKWLSLAREGEDFDDSV